LTAIGWILRIVVFGALLVLLSPVLLVLALAVRLDSPGPALFRQTRIGKNQIPFEIVKFRSMGSRPAGAIDQKREGVLGASDARITRVGRFLRRTSLDELPQLWNMLLGQMSIVGPRPFIPEQIDAIPAPYLVRFDVAPGLTGLAQVRGRRALDWMDQLAADKEYIETRSLAGDIRIIVETVRVVLTGEGVYDANARNWRDYLPGGRYRDF
jgi:lipopolysaccharide/colanic/teichoic acid biosynthesis glycosyltransferase